MEKPQTISGDFWKDHMLKGDFEAAWKFSDEVLEERKGKPCWHLPRHEQYIWDGSSLANKVVLVRCYHGLGDTIQFIRYASLLKKIAKRVIVWAQEPLLPLLESVEGIDVLIALHDGSPQVEYDADIEVMELPHYFRTVIDTIPLNFPYIHIEPIQVNEGNLLKVGLTWKVSEWEKDRSIPFESLKPIFEIQNTSIIILQSDAVAAGWSQEFGIYPGAFNLNDFASVIKGLDLLITVDSMPAHLAGAQGKPVWVMLRKEVDWRWMKDRKESPWYPSARLFRQREEGVWSDVVEEVTHELNSLSMNFRK